MVGPFVFSIPPPLCSPSSWRIHVLVIELWGCVTIIGIKERRFLGAFAMVMEMPLETHKSSGFDLRLNCCMCIDYKSSAYKVFHKGLLPYHSRCASLSLLSIWRCGMSACVFGLDRVFASVIFQSFFVCKGSFFNLSVLLLKHLEPCMVDIFMMAAISST